eukprot:7842933-Pyramimonas_sp.AAC.1
MRRRTRGRRRKRRRPPWPRGDAILLIPASAIVFDRRRPKVKIRGKPAASANSKKHPLYGKKHSMDPPTPECDLDQRRAK